MEVKESKDGYICKMTRANYTTAKNNRTLLCPNTCLISDENKVEHLYTNPQSDIGIIAKEGAKYLYYTAEQWIALSEKPTALGVYVFTENGMLVLHGTVNNVAKWSDNTTVLVPGCSIDQLAWDGEANSIAVLAAVANQTIVNAPVFTWANGLTIDGHNCFIPSKAQFESIRLNIIDINTCRTAIGQAAIAINNNYWTSTQYTAANSWLWTNTYWNANAKNYSGRALAVAAL